MKYKPKTKKTIKKRSQEAGGWKLSIFKKNRQYKKIKEQAIRILALDTLDTYVTGTDIPNHIKANKSAKEFSKTGILYEPELYKKLVANG